MILDIISSIAGLIVPPAFDFVKKKFLKSSADTPEATLSTLATTKPEVIGEYISAQSKLLESKTKWFNRDVIGDPSKWVIDLRAAIRPIFTIVSVSLMFLATMHHWEIDPGIKTLMELAISSWFGSRLCN